MIINIISCRLALIFRMTGFTALRCAYQQVELFVGHCFLSRRAHRHFFNLGHLAVHIMPESHHNLLLLWGKGAGAAFPSLE